MTGHLFGGAGGVESVFCALAVRHQISPPTINIFEQDPECDLDYCANEARDMKIDVALTTTSAGWRDQASLIFFFAMLVSTGKQGDLIAACS